MNDPENVTPPTATQDVSGTNEKKRRTIAPAAHTVVLIVVLLGFSLLTARSQHTFSAKHGRILLYASTIIWEWLLVGYILLGVRKRTAGLSELVGGRWSRFSEVVRDVAIAVGFWLVAMAVLAWLGYALGLGEAHAVSEAKQNLSFIIPRSREEVLLFLGVSATAGFCEEIIFRGYLQKQFAAWTGSEIVAVILQAIIFGGGHGYEGGPRMLMIAVYGAMFGFLALWRKSLRPGMIAHGMHDAIEGIVLHVKF